MRSRISIIAIVLIAIATALLYRNYIPNEGSFLMNNLFEILFPLNIYLIFQMIVRRFWTIARSRMVAVFVLIIMAFVIQIVHYYGIAFLGTEFNTAHILSNAIGVGIGFIIDGYILDRFEERKNK
jgi:hypothetical protein